LLAQRLSVPACEVNGQGSSPAYVIFCYISLSTSLQFFLVFFVGRLGLVGLGLGIRVRVKVQHYG